MNGKMSPGGQAWVSKEVEEIHALAPPFQICLFHFNNNYKIEVEASLSPPLLVPDYCFLLQVTKENGSSGKRPNYQTSIWCLCHNNLVLLIKVEQYIIYKQQEQNVLERSAKLNLDPGRGD